MNRKNIVTGVLLLVGIAMLLGQKYVDSKAEAVEPTTVEQPSDNKPTATTAQDGIELPAPLSDRPEQIVRHRGYTLSYNNKHNTPNWSAWALTAEHTDGPEARSQKFWADPEIPTVYRVDYYDYKDSGYDRGHMCPAGDMKWSREAMHDCFYMSNMCPQDHSLNSGSWGSLENACRSWARTEGVIYIVCGPVYKARKRHEKIGIDHVIDVPEGFFKAVLSLRPGKEKAIAFYFDNDGSKQRYKEQCMSVDEMEEMIGMDLYPAVEDELEKRIEARCNIKDWAQ